MLEIVSLIVVFIYAMYLFFLNRALNDTVDNQTEVIIAMAEELEDLGSPNVKVFRKDEIS
jgi:diacylglycerol kinase